MIKFGTGGFRGIIGEDFTKENVQLIAQAVSEIIAAEGNALPVAIGYDYRFGSEYFANWMAETFAGNGMRCLLYAEPMPTPAIMMAVRDEGLRYGVMITASHNPYNFNGVKMFLQGGVDADVEFTGKLENAVGNVTETRSLPLKQAKKQGLIVDYSNKQHYLGNIKSFLSPEIFGSDLKILYDNLYGVGSLCIQPLFDLVGMKNYKILNVEREAFFGMQMPNPTQSSMSHLKTELVEGGFDFAMATDSDSDRLGILDEKGNYVSSNHILASLYYYLVNYRKQQGDVVKNCATSILLDKLAAKLGYQCHEVDVGFKNISAGIRKYDALIGGESSGGLTVRGYIFGKDSVFSALLFTEMVTVMGKPVSEIIKEVEDFAAYSHVFVEDEIRFEQEGGLIEYLENHAPVFERKLVKCEHVGNNFKYHFENDSWALIRLSGTEPVFRVFAEFENEAEARHNVEILRSFINAYGQEEKQHA